MGSDWIAHFAVNHIIKLFLQLHVVSADVILHVSLKSREVSYLKNLGNIWEDIITQKIKGIHC